MNRLSTIAAAVLSLAWALPCAAQTTYTDTTFDLSDYTITKSLQAGTATVSQTVSGGNPGSALSVHYVIPPGPPFTNTYGNVYFLNDNFTYDPASGGALSSITWSMDKELIVTQPANYGVVGGQSFLIFQAGNYYVSVVSLPGTKGVYLTANLTSSFSDFSLVTDLASGAIDANQHPSFTAGLMEFGFRNGFGIGPQVAVDLEVFQDNFSVTLTPATAAIPEPETYAMLLLGLGLLAWKSAGRRPPRDRARA